MSATISPGCHVCLLRVDAHDDDVASLIARAREDVQASFGSIIRTTRRELLVSFTHASGIDDFVRHRLAQPASLTRATRCGVAQAPPQSGLYNALDYAVRAAAALCRAAGPGEILLDVESGLALRDPTTVEHCNLNEATTDDGRAGETLWRVSASAASSDAKPTSATPGNESDTAWDSSGPAIALDAEVEADLAVAGLAPPLTRGDGDVGASIALIHETRLLTYRCVDGAVEIGRRGDPGNPTLLQVDRPGVSRSHCWIAYEDGTLWIVDRSTNGTVLIGDDGSVMGVRRGKHWFRDPSGWIVLGSGRQAPRVRYHALDGLGATAFQPAVAIAPHSS